MAGVVLALLSTSAKGAVTALLDTSTLGLALALVNASKLLRLALLEGSRIGLVLAPM
jgi:hypothetical protein